MRAALWGWKVNQLFSSGLASVGWLPAQDGCLLPCQYRSAVSEAAAVRSCRRVLAEQSMLHLQAEAGLCHEDEAEAALADEEGTMTTTTRCACS